jgi:LVIVD repeat
MKIRCTNFWLVLGLVLLFSACEKDQIKRDGMKPVYYSFDDFSELRSGPPMTYGELGKIISSGNYIFINEKGKGIHVIDNSNPNNPVQLYFWHIIGNTEFTILQNYLYADNGKHLLIIDISNFENIALTDVIKNQYQPEFLELYPDGYSGYFECYDSTIGILIGWEKGELINPYCKTNN